MNTFSLKHLSLALRSEDVTVPWSMYITVDNLEAVILHELKFYVRILLKYEALTYDT
jgi:hypothetical protein